MSQKLFAAVFAAERHKHQTRKGDGSSYICHPLRVGLMLSRISPVVGDEVIIAGILHDTVEDTNTSLDEIKLIFGSEVAGYVEEVSDDKSLPKVTRKKLQMILAPEKSRGAQLVKLCDKIDNLRDLTRVPPKGWTTDDIRGYFLWARAVVQGIPDHPELVKEELADLFNHSIDGVKMISDNEALNEKFLQEYFVRMIE